jgi:hypothetical protein
LPPPNEISTDLADADSFVAQQGNHSITEVLFSSAILAFGLVVMGIFAFLAHTRALDGDQVFKLMGLTIVIVLLVYLIPAGYGQAQITPVIGLLGTMAGYFFGRPSRSASERSSRKDVSTKARSSENEN